MRSEDGWRWILERIYRKATLAVQVRDNNGYWLISFGYKYHIQGDLNNRNLFLTSRG